MSAKSKRPFSFSAVSAFLDVVRAHGCRDAAGVVFENPASVDVLRANPASLQRRGAVDNGACQVALHRQPGDTTPSISREGAPEGRRARELARPRGGGPRGGGGPAHARGAKLAPS